MANAREARVGRLTTGLELGGYKVAFESAATDAALLLSVSNGRTMRLRVYSWRITHGGATRSADEFRVQITGIPNGPLDPQDGRTTLLLGWDEEREVFAGWDVRLHRQPGSSPSLQVPRQLLEAASSEGITSRARSIAGGQELVVAFRPEAAGAYLEILPDLPPPNAAPDDLLASAKAASDQDVPPEELPSDVERKQAIRRMLTRVRDQRFSSRVIRAYGGRCAFCGIGAGLVEAAHIRPVEKDGPDLIVNGIAACPTHHRAFDRGLLRISGNLGIEVDEQSMRERGADDDEIASFRSTLGNKLRIPGGEDLWPGAEFVAWRNEHPAG